MKLNDEIEYAYDQSNLKNNELIPVRKSSQTHKTRTRKLKDPNRRHFATKPVITDKWLQLDINDLRQDLRELYIMKQVLHTNLLSQHIRFQNSVTGIAQTYYEVFRNGYIAADHETRHDSSDISSYIHSVMDPHLQAGSLEGINLMFTQWESYTKLLSFSNFRLVSLDFIVIENTILVKTLGEFRFIVSRDTILGIFPHIIRNEALVQQIIGLQLTCNCTIDFHFDQFGRVMRYGEEADFMGAFQSALRNPLHLALLMEGALIHEESMLGEFDTLTVNEEPPETTEKPENVETQKASKASASDSEDLDDSNCSQSCHPRRNDVAFILS
ncbi:unnamed protein product [Albugo candida]|uniref:Uncharacterized protein n=1 Tax=Albugo candida TaxID=65357 RepID=A0A024GPW0_9STRA|nr:unnamed protein product [Albugo candida]|eukprot:CCI48586.1 unnamed protein product [Albugo candida]